MPVGYSTVSTRSAIRLEAFVEQLGRARSWDAGARFEFDPCDDPYVAHVENVALAFQAVGCVFPIAMQARGMVPDAVGLIEVERCEARCGRERIARVCTAVEQLDPVGASLDHACQNLDPAFRKCHQDQHACHARSRRRGAIRMQPHLELQPVGCFGFEAGAQAKLRDGDQHVDEQHDCAR